MKYHRVRTMNNTAFQRAREAAKLPMVRVHDFRHTFGQRLRDAGVTEEDRSLLLGHAVDGMAQLYAAYFSDPGHSFQRDRGQRFNVIQDGVGAREWGSSS